MTGLRQLVSIYITIDDGESGASVAEHVPLTAAETIAEAFEAKGYKVLIDPPDFGLIQNTISWTNRNGIQGDWSKPVKAAPWREYLAVRKAVGSTRDAFDQLYEHSMQHSSYDTWDRWEVKHA